jgi:anti-anti-sigma factor
MNVNGELNEDALNAFRQAIEHQLESKEVIDVVLNLQSVPFIDSAVFEYLLDLQDQLAERMGQVKMVNCDENVARILEITRLSSEFEICSDIAQAVKETSAQH